MKPEAAELAAAAGLAAAAELPDAAELAAERAYSAELADAESLFWQADSARVVLCIVEAWWAFNGGTVFIANNMTAKPVRRLIKARE